jgi:DNA-binding CsgD family transcriptional regulator
VRIEQRDFKKPHRCLPARTVAVCESGVQDAGVDDRSGSTEAGGLVGREHEQAAITQLLSTVRDGFSGAIVLTGEAGIGKTALLDWAVDRAGELSVMRLVGIESEMELGFAGLHQLLSPLLSGLDALPPPQAGALRAAFGLSDESAPDRFMVGLAALTLLASTVSGSGLLIVVDDAQWLDQESLAVIGFVARRLFADRIALLIAVQAQNGGTSLLEGLPNVRLERLARRQAIALMTSVADSPIDQQVRTRILAEAAGHPLAIVEFAREYSGAFLGFEAVLPQPLSPGPQLLKRYQEQVRSLPLGTQRLLLAAAADPTGDLALLSRVGLELGFDSRDFGEAEAADLIGMGPPVTFRHPLVREAVYHGATDNERRRTHEALARATEADPDRRAWHRAASALGPDEEVAAELERAANRAANQGGYATSAAYLSRAALLSPEPGRRGTRLLGAATADLAAGRPAQAHVNLELCAPILESDLLRAQAKRLEGAILFALGGATEPPSIMLQAATALAKYDVALAREVLLEALLMALWIGKWASAGPQEVGHAVKALPLPTDTEPNSADLLLNAFAELHCNGHAAAALLLRKALAAMKVDPWMREVPRRMSFGCWAAIGLGDTEAWRDLADEFIDLARLTGAIRLLPEALSYRGTLELSVGSLSTADGYFSEERDLQAVRGSGLSGDVGRLFVLAWRGHETEARTLAAELVATARERRAGLAAARIDAAIALLELGLGRYSAATGRLAEGWQDDTAFSVFTASDAIEAHARGGDRQEADALLEWLAQRADANGAPIEMGLLARSRAMLGDDASAERHYQESIAVLTGAGATLQTARSQLLYGEWLRRQKRRRDAREQLRAACQTFEAMGALGFAERCRIELMATGETARHREDAEEVLTPQETQVARLAASGLTNPEIGAQLFISAATVDYHLRKVYRKLHINSRVSLARSLPGGA